MHHYVNDVAELVVTFKNRAGALADPETVSVQVKPPTGPAIPYEGGPELTHPSLGKYVLRFRLLASGSYKVVALGTSSDLDLGVNASARRLFNVEPNGWE